MRLIHITHTEHANSATYYHWIQTAWVGRPPEGIRVRVPALRRVR